MTSLELRQLAQVADPMVKAAIEREMRPKATETIGEAVTRCARGMNKLESDYARRLEVLKQTGAVLWFGYEAVSVRLADRTFYHPDFLVLLPGGRFEIHETKGFMRDDANVKLKVAAAMLPIRLVLVKRHKGRWTFKEIPGAVDRIVAGAERGNG